MKKAVAIISDNPELKALTDRLDAIDAEHEERMKFIEKQAEDAHKSAREKSKPVMEDLRARLRAKGKLVSDEHHVIYNTNADTISVTDDEHMQDMMAHRMMHRLAAALGFRMV